MRKEFLWLFFIVVLLALIIVLFTLFAANSGVAKSLREDKKIALINLTGEITDNTEMLKLLNAYGDMDSVKAIIIRVNSPGGSVGASQEIYRQIMRLRASGKKNSNFHERYCRLGSVLHSCCCG